MCVKRLPAALTNNAPRDTVRGMEDGAIEGGVKAPLLAVRRGRLLKLKIETYSTDSPAACVCVYMVVMTGLQWVWPSLQTHGVCRYSHSHLQCEKTPLLMHLLPSCLWTRPPLGIKGTFVLNLVPRFSALLFCRPTVNIRCKSAYFQIPSIWVGQTKRGLYSLLKARRKDANRACQCVPRLGRVLTMAAVWGSVAIDQSDVVLCGMDVANRIKPKKVERKWRDLADGI